MQEPVTHQAIARKGIQQGRQEEACSLIQRQLARRVGDREPILQGRIQRLIVNQLEVLGEALLDFSTVTELRLWLDKH